MCVPKILIALSSYAENVEMTINLYRVLINVYKDCSVLQSLVDALVLQVCGGEPREQEAPSPLCFVSHFIVLEKIFHISFFFRQKGNCKRSCNMFNLQVLGFLAFEI